MKILFLDIDGVLTSGRVHLAYRKGGIWTDFDPIGVSALLKVCETGVKLVISSTWRKFPDHLWREMEKNDLKQYVYFPDWKTTDLGYNPATGSDYQRGDEIKEYLGRHPEIDSYRILDDNSDMDALPSKKLILTDGENGITTQNILKLYRWSGVMK